MGELAPEWALKNPVPALMIIGRERVPGVGGRSSGAVEHGFAHLKTWRILTKLRTSPARATNLLRALLVLTNLELDRGQTIKTENSRPRPARAPTNPATPAVAPAKTKMVDLQ
ncbi:hypothetical protein [Nonomuraea guangzhouensis]|uniref:DDE Tnp4 domain-containing protein n=1 Tax=Nonomuraea guangzhouensis TaxID=1291555 RepID=A0ABW4G3U4_9ACTN|nr:hypothetical protein [Nonomuraea guangzhouensis]